MKRMLIADRFKKQKKATKKIKTVSQKIKEFELFFGFFFVILFLTAGLLYVFQINSISTKGYEIEDYEKEFLDLKKENQKLSIELADLKSMENLENKIEKFSSINYKDITYIISSPGVVAMGK